MQRYCTLRGAGGRPGSPAACEARHVVSLWSSELSSGGPTPPKSPALHEFCHKLLKSLRTPCLFAVQAAPHSLRLLRVLPLCSTWAHRLQPQPAPVHILRLLCVPPRSPWPQLQICLERSACDQSEDQANPWACWASGMTMI
jgi:hypothetical protein